MFGAQESLNEPPKVVIEEIESVILEDKQEVFPT